MRHGRQAHAPCGARWQNPTWTPSSPSPVPSSASTISPRLLRRSASTADGEIADEADDADAGDADAGDADHGDEETVEFGADTADSTGDLELEDEALEFDDTPESATANGSVDTDPDPEPDDVTEPDEVTELDDDPGLDSDPEPDDVTEPDDDPELDEVTAPTKRFLRRARRR